MTTQTLTIATRESPLALWQANWVKTCLEHHYPNLQVQLLGMTTQADRKPYVSLQEIGGKGLFVKELETALLDKRADIAVHCLKDMPVMEPAGLRITAFLERESPEDVFVSNQAPTLANLPPQAIVGTSSLRRQSQLLHLRPDLQVRALRGNVNTRLAKLDAGEFDAIILAAAGLKRLGLLSRPHAVLASDAFLPAAAQGILAIQCREDDINMHALVAFLHHPPTHYQALAERAVSRRLGANCQVPVAAFAMVQQNQLWLRGLVCNRAGTVMLRAEQIGAVTDAEHLGASVGDALLQQGAADILQACLRNQDIV